MDTDKIKELFVQSFGEELAKETNVPFYYLNNIEQTESIVDRIRNKLPKNESQRFKDISDSELREQISELSST